ncbi:hypothetical protein D1872_232840 [compost metagenome]
MTWRRAFPSAIYYFFQFVRQFRLYLLGFGRINFTFTQCFVDISGDRLRQFLHIFVLCPAFIRLYDLLKGLALLHLLHDRFRIDPGEIGSIFNNVAATEMTAMMLRLELIKL